ncbi:MAG: hypothetical protein COZ47_11920 [Lysobacterales bacterium CG_4_10_14_3_um_filter_64_11]|nr:MAG: hypothetical protein COZ47_11920 [Xanthomonadales bacterium CG_4_10_14_3_um_filter_64_11]
MADRHARVKFLVLWGVLVVARLLLSVRLPVFGDEAFYWLEGQHLAWAYSDLPAATAALARLGVELGGNQAWALRLPFGLLAALMPWLVIAIARHLGARGAHAWQAGSLAVLLPALAGLGVMALPDVPLTLAILLCVEAVLALLTRFSAAAVLRLTLGLVLGGFSHYRFALPLLAASIALLATSGGRALLRRPALWLATAMGALAWLPLLLWNLRHHGAGLAFQLQERHPWQFHGDGALFVPIQLLLLTPLLAVAMALAVRRGWCGWRAQRDARHGFVLIASLLLLAAYFVLGFFADRQRVSFHWPLPAYLPLLALVPLVLADWRSLWRRATWVLLALGTVLSLGYLAAISVPALRSQMASTGAYPDNFAGWSQVATHTREALDSMPRETRVIADNFMLAAQLGFALDGKPVAVLDHPLNHKHGRAAQLALWGRVPPPGPLPPPALLVVEDSAVALKDRLRAYARACERHGPLPVPAVLNVDHGRKRFLLYRLLRAADSSACVLPAVAWIDQPQAGSRVAGEVAVRGWAFKDGAGVARIDISVDGVAVAQARYGLPAPHVAAYWQISNDHAHPDVGFGATFDSSTLTPGRHWLGLIVHGRDGSIEPWPEQVFRVD